MVGLVGCGIKEILINDFPQLLITQDLNGKVRFGIFARIGELSNKPEE
jgi:hypothetical protein